LGGSLGIAASSAVLGTTLRSRLAGIVDFQLLNTLENVMGELSQEQQSAVRGAYSDAFTRYMRICTIIACISIPLTLIGWTRERVKITDRTQQKTKDEIARRRALVIAAARKAASAGA
jgi:hypothetical protein